MRLQSIVICTFAALLIGSCKEETKTTKVPQEPIIIENDDSASKPKYTYKQVPNLLENPNTKMIIGESHKFTPEIAFLSAHILKTKEDTYSLMLTIDEEDTNFKELVTWKIGAMLFAEDPALFKDATSKAKGYRSFGIMGTPVMMGATPVLFISDVKLTPKKYKSVRFYLYNSEGDKKMNYFQGADITID